MFTDCHAAAQFSLLVGRIFLQGRRFKSSLCGAFNLVVKYGPMKQSDSHFALGFTKEYNVKKY